MPVRLRAVSRRPHAGSVGFSAVLSTVLSAGSAGVNFPANTEAAVPARPRILSEVVRGKLRAGRHARRTEEDCSGWVRRFIRFHGGRHPRELGEAEVAAFLEDPAVRGQVAAATQNQALNAVMFLYGQVLKRQLGTPGAFARARRPERLPVVLDPSEVRALLAALEGTNRLIAQMLYGCGPRLLEALRLWVKEVDFARLQVTVRGGKGGKDRVTMLPVSAVEPLREHVTAVPGLHERELAAGRGEVWLPDGLPRTLSGAARAWPRQWMFPAKQLYTGRDTGRQGRQHVHENALQKAVQAAVRKAGLGKRATCHTLRHSFATHLLENGTALIRSRPPAHPCGASRFARIPISVSQTEIVARCRSCSGTGMWPRRRC